MAENKLTRKEKIEYMRNNPINLKSKIPIRKLEIIKERRKF